MQEYITSWGCFAFQTSYNFFTHGPSPWPREGESPTAPPAPLPEGKQGVTANATWSGRHFSQMPGVMVPVALPVCHKPSGLPAEPSLGRREEKMEKKKNSKPAASRAQSTANAQDLPSKLGQDIPRRPFPIEHPGFGERGWDKENVLECLSQCKPFPSSELQQGGAA